MTTAEEIRRAHAEMLERFGTLARKGRYMGEPLPLTVTITERQRLDDEDEALLADLVRRGRRVRVIVSIGIAARQMEKEAA